MELKTKAQIWHLRTGKGSLFVLATSSQKVYAFCDEVANVLSIYLRSASVYGLVSLVESADHL